MSSTRISCTDVTVKFEKFVGKAPVIEAVLLTADNIDELAAWLGADGYTLDKILKGDHQQVMFVKHPMRRVDGKEFQDRNNPVRIVRALLGEWIVRYPKHVNNHGGERDEYYYSLSQEEIDAFVKQQYDNGEIDISPPYDH